MPVAAAHAACCVSGVSGCCVSPVSTGHRAGSPDRRGVVVGAAQVPRGGQAERPSVEPGHTRPVQGDTGISGRAQAHQDSREDAGYRRQFSHVLTQLREQQSQYQIITGRSQAAFRVGGALALAGLTYVSLVPMQLPAASLLVLIAIFSRMLPQVSGIHMNLQQSGRIRPAFDNWRRWIDACEAEVEPKEPVTGGDGVSANLQSGMHLKNVAYRHPAGHMAFEVTDLLIPAHRTTAIVGPTGSGKTTLLDLLSGLTPPDSGTIEVDGQPLASCAGWRRQIAYIPQETAILDVVRCVTI